MVLPGDSSRHRQFHDSMIRRYSGIYRQPKYKIFTAQGRRETLNIYFKRLESKSNNSPARITKLAKMIAHWRPIGSPESTQILPCNAPCISLEFHFAAVNSIGLEFPNPQPNQAPIHMEKSVSRTTSIQPLGFVLFPCFALPIETVT